MVNNGILSFPIDPPPQGGSSFTSQTDRPGRRKTPERSYEMAVGQSTPAPRFSVCISFFWVAGFFLGVNF